MKYIPNRTASFLITSVLVPRPLFMSHLNYCSMSRAFFCLLSLLSLLCPVVPIQPMVTSIKCKWDCHFPPTISSHTEIKFKILTARQKLSSILICLSATASTECPSRPLCASLHPSPQHGTTVSFLVVWFKKRNLSSYFRTLALALSSAYSILPLNIERLTHPNHKWYIS